MATPERRHGGRIFYERGEQLELAYPTFDAPTARLTVMRNPNYGTPHEHASLPQGTVKTPTGRSLAGSIAGNAVRFLGYEWSHMPEGFTQFQRITGTTIAKTDSEVDPAFASIDWLVSFGFRSFDGLAPSAVKVQELNSIGTVVATHTVTINTEDRKKYPQGLTRQLDVEFTSDAATHQIRVRAESTGQDFAIGDIQAIHAGGDAFEDTDLVFDSDSDGLADGWAVMSGSASDCSHYGEDAAGLRQWIEEICDGALETFEVRRPGSGVVSLVRLIDPTSEIGWPTGTAGTVSGVRILLEVRP